MATGWCRAESEELEVGGEVGETRDTMRGGLRVTGLVDVTGIDLVVLETRSEDMDTPNIGLNTFIEDTHVLFLLRAK